jgi:hypothetical protein
MPCQERDFWEMGPGTCEGRRPGNLQCRAAGRECNCALPMANGKENLGELLPKRCTASILRGRSNDHALRHEPACRFQTGRTGERAIRAHRMTWGILSSPTRSGRAFLAGSYRRMASTDEKKVSVP